MLSNLTDDARQYLLITANYWAFTLTDGALRMLVVLFFHQLGYSPLEIAFLFIFYEFFGVVTNLVGGWLGARLGLNRTMNVGLALQIFALLMLALPSQYLSIAWVMAAQALSGIAKDLNKMSAKSSIKMLVPKDQSGKLYHWVATLTGSKNTLKGIGFFIGGLLLIWIGFQAAVFSMAAALCLIWLFSIYNLKPGLGMVGKKAKFTQLFSKSTAINRLSLARLFLFAARDVWFVVALPVFLSTNFNWSHWQVGAFMACWVIAYGIVQTQAPKFTLKTRVPDGATAMRWAAALTLIPACIAIGLAYTNIALVSLVAGLMIFGFVFAVNSSIHSFLIVHYANEESVSMDVGFYYMSNAAGRLAGTVLSGWVFQQFGLSACLLVSSACLLVATLVSLSLPQKQFLNEIP